MRSADGVEATELGTGFLGAERRARPKPLWDEHGAAFVDTGVPGGVEAAGRPALAPLLPQPP